MPVDVGVLQGWKGNMRIDIDWGTRNVLTAQLRLSEMQAAAQHLTKMCEKRCEELGVNTLTLDVGVTHVLDTLIHNYLPANFKLIENLDTEDEVLDDHLTYSII